MTDIDRAYRMSQEFLQIWRQILDAVRWREIRFGRTGFGKMFRFVILSEAKNPSSIALASQIMPRHQNPAERFFASLRMTTF
jgi:hypothetical protein